MHSSRGSDEDMLLESFPNLANYGTYEANVKRNMI